MVLALPCLERTKPRKSSRTVFVSPSPVDARRYRGLRVLELGAGVGAASIALAGCGAFVVASDVSLAALELVAENAARAGAAVSPLQAKTAASGGGRVVPPPSGTLGETKPGLAALRRASLVPTSQKRARPHLQVPWRLDWTDDAQLAAVDAAHGPFDVVVGAALRFEAWPKGRLATVLDRLARGTVVLAHAFHDVEDYVGPPWARTGAVAGAEIGLDEFSAVSFRRRQPSSFPPTAHDAGAEL